MKSGINGGLLNSEGAESERALRTTTLNNLPERFVFIAERSNLNAMYRPPDLPIARFNDLANRGCNLRVTVMAILSHASLPLCAHVREQDSHRGDS
jgi:hypothetical protein